jgi:enoyl-CoA hydratase/carnithine racemase
MSKDVSVSMDGHVATVVFSRPPQNFFDAALIANLADAFEALDKDATCRALVLASEGKVFCAGADLANRPDTGTGSEAGGKVKHLYNEALRLYRSKKPVVGAIQGAAVGGGLGVACVPDFRVTCSEARFCANFSRLGFHPGFGLTAVLPRIVGPQQAALLFYTGRRISGEEALRIGLADRLVPQSDVRKAAQALAKEIAESGPLAVVSVRETLRRGLADEIEKATERELFEQEWLRRTADFKEGVKAMNERRLPKFEGR